MSYGTQHEANNKDTHTQQLMCIGYYLFILNIILLQNNFTHAWKIVKSNLHAAKKYYFTPFPLSYRIILCLYMS